MTNTNTAAADINLFDLLDAAGPVDGVTVVPMIEMTAPPADTAFASATAAAARDGYKLSDLGGSLRAWYIDNATTRYRDAVRAWFEAHCQAGMIGSAEHRDLAPEWVLAENGARRTYRAAA